MVNEDFKYINKHLEIVFNDKPEILSNKTLVQILLNNLLNNAVNTGKHEKLFCPIEQR